MTEILRQLGDELANQKPDLEGANSPFAILTHCLGVMEYWGGQFVAGRSIQRDRDAEFSAVGKIDDLLRRMEQSKKRLAEDLRAADSTAPPRFKDPYDAHLPLGKTQGGVLLHIYEELSQHLGQMEITRDLLLSGSGA
jgi:hypothetical protein